MVARWLAGFLFVVVTAFLTASPAFALYTRIAACGRVTSLTPAQAGAGPILRLGTQDPRSLGIGGLLPQVGDEVCIWGVAVGNTNVPASDPAANGIAEWRVAPVASIGCADTVTAMSASFVMPGEAASALPNHATLVLPLRVPVASGCVRIAVDASGNPVAVVITRAGPTATPTPRASVASLPSTDTTDGSTVVSMVALAILVLVASLVVGIRARRGIPS